MQETKYYVQISSRACPEFRPTAFLEKHYGVYDPTKSYFVWHDWKGIRELKRMDFQVDEVRQVTDEFYNENPDVQLNASMLLYISRKSKEAWKMMRRRKAKEFLEKIFRFKERSVAV